MNFGTLAGFLGLLLCYVGLSMLVPFGVSLYFGEGAAGAFAASAALTLAAGLVLRRGRRVAGLAPREAFAATALGWVATSAAGALPLLLSGALPSYVDALFEAVSGVTTTGATVIGDVAHLPRSIVLWRALLQWLGGMGIVVLSLALLPQIGAGGMELFKAEAPTPIPERLKPRLRETAHVLWRLYIGLTLLLLVLLVGAGMPPFEALVHALTTIPTGGFSTRPDSVQGFNSPAVELVLAFFMFVSGVNFALLYKAWASRNVRCILRDPEFRAYAAVLGAAAALMAVSLWRSGTYGPLNALRHAAFQAIALVTTTGFATADYASWPPFALLVVLLLMFVGGCAGSTAGGIKVLRHMVVAKHGYREILRLVHPRAVRPVRIGARAVDEGVIAGVLAFVVLYMMLFAAGTVAVAAYGTDLLTAASAVAGALGNVGPGLGAVGPMATYASFAPTAKLLLALLMLIGRLEIYTVLVLLIPATWTRARAAAGRPDPPGR